MRAQQPVELAWDEIPLHTQLDVLIYDMIEGGHWVTVKSWARKHTSHALLQALAQRKQIWNKNRLPHATQKAYTERATHRMSHSTIVCVARAVD